MTKGLVERSDYPMQTYEKFNCFKPFPFNVPGQVKMVSGKESISLLNKFDSFKNKEIVKDADYRQFSKGREDYSDYSVHKHKGGGFLGYYKDDVWLDGEYSYLLKRGTDLGAVLSISPRPEAIMVTQIQGMKSGKDVCSGFRYTDFLLDFWEKDFKNVDVAELWVLPYFRNGWYDVKENKHDNKRRQYDIPAKRQGFEFDIKKGLWIKAVSS